MAKSSDVQGRRSIGPNLANSKEQEHKLYQILVLYRKLSFYLFCSMHTTNSKLQTYRGSGYQILVHYQYLLVFDSLAYICPAKFTSSSALTLIRIGVRVTWCETRCAVAEGGVHIGLDELMRTVHFVGPVELIVNEKRDQ